MIEEYKDIPGYEGLYQVSNFGNVISLQSRWGLRKKPRKVCDTSDSRGYRQLSLSKNNKNRLFKIHQLVAMAFLGHTPDGHNTEINHIDENKINNHVSNLQILKKDGNISAVRQNKIYSTECAHFDKSRNKWKSVIRIKGKRVHLGRFDTKEEAIKAYQIALTKL